MKAISLRQPWAPLWVLDGLVVLLVLGLIHHLGTLAGWW